jgi:hypothetical protein
MRCMSCDHTPGAVAESRQRSQRHQHIHIGRADAQALECAPDETPAADELHGSGQRQLHIRRQQRAVAIAQHRSDHVGQKRQEQQGGNHEKQERPAFVGPPIRFQPLARQLPLLRRSHPGTRAITCCFHGSDSGGRVDASADVSPFQRHIDADGSRTRQPLQSLLDHARTAGAMHAGDVERESGSGDE